MGLIPGSGRFPEVGNGNPLQSLAWKIPWTESLAGYRPWGSKESDMTENTHTHVPSLPLFCEFKINPK